MQNEPNFQKSQMLITLRKTTNYNKKPAVDTWSKRTQNKPNFALHPMRCKGKPNFRRIQKRLLRCARNDRWLLFFKKFRLVGGVFLFVVFEVQVFAGLGGDFSATLCPAQETDL